jgi:hypothetical protein
VRSKVESQGRPPVRLNLAAPMSSLENQALKTLYLQIVQAAWESSFGEEPLAIDQGCKLADLEDFLRPLMERKPLDPSERLFDVLPETVAPIVSLSQNPRMSPGMYMIVDIGAGSTELSVNHVDAANAEQKVLCYADESVLLGCDHYEWAESQASKARVETPSAQNDLTDRLVRVLERVWASGYKKDGGNLVARERWKKLSVLLAGGGARRVEIVAAIRKVRPQYPWPQRERSCSLDWHRPTELVGLGSSSSTQKEELSLLAVAHGLSVERRQWPIVFSPGQIQTVPSTVIPPPLPAYWYVEAK